MESKQISQCIPPMHVKLDNPVSLRRLFGSSLLLPAAPLPGEPWSIVLVSDPDHCVTK